MLLLLLLLLLQGPNLVLGRCSATCLSLLLSFLGFSRLVCLGDRLMENPVLLIEDPLLRQVLGLLLSLLQLLQRRPPGCCGWDGSPCAPALAAAAA